MKKFLLFVYILAIFASIIAFFISIINLDVTSIIITFTLSVLFIYVYFNEKEKLNIKSKKNDTNNIANSTNSNDKVKNNNITIPSTTLNYELENNEANIALSNYKFYGMINFRLLTNNEYVFFYQLKRIADKYDLLVFPKVRLADIFKTKDEWEFKKVSSRHIDFTICDRYSRPIVFIELDDNSHVSSQQQIRDMKKDKIFECMNIKLNRVKINEINKGLYDIEEQIKNILNIKEEKKYTL